MTKPLRLDPLHHLTPTNRAEVARIATGESRLRAEVLNALVERGLNLRELPPLNEGESAKDYRERLEAVALGAM